MAIWPKIFAAIYDPLLARGEQEGMRDRRQDLLSRARGRVLEVGAGTGLNLPHYPRELDELVLAEPEEAMRRRLERRVAELGSRARVVAAEAEALPFEDSSFDVVVATLVLCTVADPAAALAQIDRVLRPQGELLFIEHVRADEPRLARWQDRLHRPWRAFACGCHCNRQTVETLQAGRWSLAELDRFSLPAAPPLVRPAVAGRARAGVGVH